MHLSPLSPHVSQNLENLLQVFRPLSPGAQPVSRTRAPVFAAQISGENCRVPSCLLQDKEEHSPETVSTLTSAGEGTSTRGSTSRIFFFIMLYRTRFPSLTRRASSTSTYQQLLSSQMSRISLTRSCYGLSPKIHTRCLKSLCCSLSFYFIIIFSGCLCIQSLSSASVTRRWWPARLFGFQQMNVSEHSFKKKKPKLRNTFIGTTLYWFWPCISC